MAFPRRSIGLATAGLALAGATYVARRMMVRRTRPYAHKRGNRGTPGGDISGVVERTPDQVVDVPGPYPSQKPFH